MIRRGLKRACLVLAIYLVYLVIGAMAPFWQTPALPSGERVSAPVEELLTDRETPDRAQILETNRSAWTERLRLLSRAEESIVMSTFDMRDGESTRDILSVLYQKAQEGVEVRILVDGISGFLRMGGRPLFETLQAHPNIEIRLYNPITFWTVLTPWTTQGRMHDKYIIVDDLAYILGGRNTFDYFIGEYPTDHRSLDREVLVYNGGHGAPEGRESSLYQVLDYFHQVWNSEACAPYGGTAGEAEQEEVQTMLQERYDALTAAEPALFDPSYDYAAHTVETQGVTLLSNPTHIYAKEPVLFAQMMALADRAEESVVLHTPYAVLNDAMADTLAAVAEEVPVTVMLNAVENGDNVVASSDYRYHRDEVMGTGVQLLEYAGGLSYHGKSMVVDGEIVLIGSYNLDLRSTYVDTELMVAVRSPQLAQELLESMEGLHRDCRLASPEGDTVPDGLTIPEAPWTRQAVWTVLGLVLQPFRILV